MVLRSIIAGWYGYPPHHMLLKNALKGQIVIIQR